MLQVFWAPISLMNKRLSGCHIALAIQLAFTCFPVHAEHDAAPAFKAITKESPWTISRRAAS